MKFENLFHRPNALWNRSFKLSSHWNDSWLIMDMKSIMTTVFSSEVLLILLAYNLGVSKHFGPKEI